MALKILRDRWGHAAFRPGQWQVIESVLARRDTVAILPTGTGKSVCYQVPGLILPGTAVVVSPLIALMRDQVDRLLVRGIRAAAINSSLSRAEKDQAWREARSGGLRFIYVSPEQLKADQFQRLLASIQLSFIAIDEAHCVVEWGRRFRPAYRQIAQAVPQSAARVALTATASRPVQREMKRVLRLRNPISVVTGYDRPNLYWDVRKVNTLTPHVERLVRLNRGSIVVYCMTRRAVEWWSQWFAFRRIPASYYHGGLGSRARDQAQTDWLSDRTRVMVATNAFGMGIDKPDVRLVLHLGLPTNIAAYYQEAGRAGRDGAHATAALLYQNADILIRKRLIANSSGRRGFFATTSQAVRAFAELQKYLRSPICRRRYILNYFGEAYSRACGNCDRCCDRVKPDSAITSANKLPFLKEAVKNRVPRPSGGEVRESKPASVDVEPNEPTNDGAFGELERHLSDDPDLAHRLVRDGFVEYVPNLSTFRLTGLGRRVARTLQSRIAET